MVKRKSYSPQFKAKVAIEAIKGKPLSEKTKEFGFRIGMALILVLMAFVFYNDLS